MQPRRVDQATGKAVSEYGAGESRLSLCQSVMRVILRIMEHCSLIAQGDSTR